jgi:peptidoglycan/LPS O-acetylase OafA/YrhL
MSAQGHHQDPVLTTVLHDPAEDMAHTRHEHPHDQASEVAHAWHHFQENVKFFACFLSVILLTVFAFNVNFGRWNIVAVLVLAAMRSGLIAYFMASMFKPFSFVFRTFVFSAIFLAGMIFLSLWDSEIGDPIKDRINVPPPPSHVP